MSDDNNKNDNHFDENQSDGSSLNNKNNVGSRLNRFIRHSLFYGLLLFFFVILVVILISGINFKEKKENSNNIKISTPEQCKEKGLHYIGEIPSTKFIVQSIKLNDGNILIIWRHTRFANKPENTIKVGRDKSHDYNPFFDDIKEYSAEIFNPTNNEFITIKSKPLQKEYNEYRSKLFIHNDNNVLLVSEGFEIFDIKTKTFKEVGKNKIKLDGEYTYVNPSFFDKTDDDNLLQCEGYISPYFSPSHSNMCWITDLKNFKVKETYKINIDIPRYLIPAHLGYIKINESQILIYARSFPTPNTTNIYIAIWDINQKKIIKEKEITGIGNYYNLLKPILLDENRILFFGGVENEGKYFIKKIFPSYIYDFKKDKIQEFKEAEKQPIIELFNKNLLIFEYDKIKEIYNYKTKKTKSIDNLKLRNLLISNIIQINDNQLLLISDDNEYVSKRDIRTYFYRMKNNENDDKKSRSVWIYTF